MDNGSPSLIRGEFCASSSLRFAARHLAESSTPLASERDTDIYSALLMLALLGLISSAILL